MARDSAPDRPQLVIAKHDRWHRFVLRRSLDARGLYLYEIQNTARKERLTVPLDLYDRFRALVAQIQSEIATTEEKKVALELRFGGRTRYAMQWARANPESVVLRSFGPDELPQNDMVVAPNALSPLLAVLHHPKVRHPNDLLVRIVTYHRLFAATFTEGTESITSNLQLRRGLLSHVERYVPALAKKTRVQDGDTDLVEPAMLKQFAPEKAPAVTQRTFRSRLGERDEAKQYQVDYESLFADPGSGPNVPAGRRKRGQEKIDTTVTDEPVNYFSVPLLAAEVKKFDKVPFRCMLSRDEVKQLRTNFLDDRDASFYLGFEIFDGIFDKRGKLQTYRFPLYYLPIRIVESGREAILHPLEEERVYLNHFALANLVETYSPSGQAPKRLDDFLSALLSHQFTIRGVPDRIRLLRMLPCTTDVFDRTREILLGLPGENGKGGLLADVKVRAIECDLESVYLYKAPQSSSPITRALHDDLSQILTKTDALPDAFESSLLARSLSPQTKATEATDRFSETLSMHGAQAKSIRTLTERLNAHDLVMLEGPPGTGKTYNIANLLIHCVATGKRLLVVSDQAAAVHALTEQIQRYVVGPDGLETAEGRELDQLWRLGIKVVDELPTGTETLSSWARQVRRMLGVDASKELEWPSGVPGYEETIARIDDKIQQSVEAIGEVMNRRFGNDHHWRMPSVSARTEHPSKPDAIEMALASVAHLTGSSAHLETLRTHVGYRERVIEFGLHDSYELFSLEGRPDVAMPRLSSVVTWLKQLDELAPVTVEDFDKVEAGEAAHAVRAVLRKRWHEAFPPDQSWTGRAATFVRSLWGQHELHRLVVELTSIVSAQQALWQDKETIDPELWDALARLHLALAPSGHKPLDVRLELLLAAGRRDADAESIQEQLEAVATLQSERDRFVRRQFLHGLGAIGRRAFEASKRGGTNRLTSILATLDRLESAATWARAHDAVRELQDLLFEVFPVWISRKQVVPFLLPCREQTFDLVIVDEATQCRVDDAIPLLFRGRKLMAVGDERQTVLAKNSAIDDYLFDDFELDEHLRFAQARGMKGGGSHLFGLVKRIKQASVMLDEHYRCPPDIIEFSNRYVYGSQLRTMQWTMTGSPPAVIVDHSESNRDSSERQQTGRFKGIETDMIDRFMSYTARVLRRIERETGEEINSDTDVALVYFLLKNEPYVQEAKGQLLKKLYRGSDVLDGAGAALQGKERNYIFYLWDITRYNIANFRQGDDETKRKGELNVLMSRPKKRAYHFLHRDFAKLKHHSTTITDYLWRTYQAQTRSKKKKASEGSGRLLLQLVKGALKEHGPVDEEVQLNVTLGNPLFGVDVMWLPPEERRGELPSIGLVDLGVFMAVKDPGQEVVDYFFQVQRAIPAVVPVFGFMHEFADRSSAVIDRVKSLSHKR